MKNLLMVFMVGIISIGCAAQVNIFTDLKNEYDQYNEYLENSNWTLAEAKERTIMGKTILTLLYLFESGESLPDSMTAAYTRLNTLGGVTYNIPSLTYDATVGTDFATIQFDSANLKQYSLWFDYVHTNDSILSLVATYQFDSVYVGAAWVDYIHTNDSILTLVRTYQFDSIYVDRWIDYIHTADSIKALAIDTVENTDSLNISFLYAGNTEDTIVANILEADTFYLNKSLPIWISKANYANGFRVHIDGEDFAFTESSNESWFAADNLGIGASFLKEKKTGDTCATAEWARTTFASAGLDVGDIADNTFLIDSADNAAGMGYADGDSSSVPGDLNVVGDLTVSGTTPRTISFFCTGDSIAEVTDSCGYVVVTADMDTLKLEDMQVSSFNNADRVVTVGVRRIRGATTVAMTQTGATLGAEYTVADAVIDTNNNSVLAGDIIYVIWAQAVAGPGSNTRHYGLFVGLDFQKQ